MKLQLISESVVTLSNLTIDVSDIDKATSKPLEKLSLLSKTLLGENFAQRHIYLLFYFDLPQGLLDIILNEDCIKINFDQSDYTPKGFMSGSVGEFAILAQFACHESKHAGFRLFGNLLYNFLKIKYDILPKVSMRQLSDGTFALIGNN